jgi:hypothetical protein
MSISSNATYFNGQRVEDFNATTGIINPAIAYRFRTDYDGEDHAVMNDLKVFLADEKLPLVQNFVIGMWGVEHDDTPTEIINLLVANKEKLHHIKGIFFGDITYEENEISWIENTNHHPILEALPNLEIYQVRGGNGLDLGNLQHPNLQQLIVETGGMSRSILSAVAQSNLPKLHHLELWLGSSDYGFEGSVEDVLHTYRGQNRLPNLKYLGLRNSEIADDIAIQLKGDAILDRIEVLDLSMGVLTDKGAEALFDNPAIKNLKKIDLHHNYISDDWAEKLADLGVKIDLSERDTEEEEDYRYVEVGE